MRASRISLLCGFVAAAMGCGGNALEPVDAGVDAVAAVDLAARLLDGAAPLPDLAAPAIPLDAATADRPSVDGTPGDLARPVDALPLPPMNLCRLPVPPGRSPPPPPPKYSGGACPKLVPGSNTILSGGAKRSFLLAVPKNFDAKEQPPLLFLWHWLGGSANSFYTKGEIQAAVDGQRFIAVLPEAKGDLLFKWPFEAVQLQARMDEEFRFFDDLYACVGAQFGVNPNCVASAGVSAGALFTDQLAAARGQYLASALSLSGGTGGLIRPFGNPEHRLPFLVLWGGPSDACFGVMNFDTGSRTLEAALGDRGHFFLECVHNCGHSEPPLDAPQGLSRYAALWQFVFDHPYWLAPGESPYRQHGLPKVYPSWCGIGPKSAPPRQGACANKPGC